MCAHPYGKDSLPKPGRGGGFKPSFQYRIFRMPEPVAGSISRSMLNLTAAASTGVPSWNRTFFLSLKV